MQTRPIGWEALLYGAHKVEYKYVINGVEYPAEYIQGTPSIEKPLMLKPVIGRCCTGSFNITVRSMPNVSIPKAAQVKVSCRLSSPDGSSITTWIPQGEYWIVKRKGQGDLLTLTCRDNMIFAGRSYTDKTQYTEWPVAMVDVFNEIVALMGVQVDPRTAINSGDAYMCDYPNPDELMSEILAKIAAAHGGNFIMTESGKLRLVPFPSTTDPVYLMGTNYTNGGYEPYSTGEKIISRVTLKDSAGNEFSLGDDTGEEVIGECNSATQLLVNDVAYSFYVSDGTLYSQHGRFVNDTANMTEDDAEIVNGSLAATTHGLIGKQFRPYHLSGAYFDPCVELGDTYSILYRGESINLIANSMRIDCTVGFYTELENGVPDDDEEEIPYMSPAELKAQRTISTDQKYFGNRINRSEGFVSEYMMDDVAVARMIANSNLFTMQRFTDGKWEDVLYFDPVEGQYKFSGEVSIDTRGFKASSVQVDNPSIAFAANAEGEILAAANITVNVLAYTGNASVIPDVSVVTGLPAGMTAIIGSPDDHNRVPINLIVAQGETLGSIESISGELSIIVTGPIYDTLKVNWCKVNTGLTGPQGEGGKSGTNGVSQTVVQLYQRAATQPETPGACTYTFSTNALSGAVGSWLRSIPDGTNPCWTVSAAVFSTDDTVAIPANAWTSVIKLVENGTNGKDGTSVTILGSYDTIAELKAAHPTGNSGDSYIVSGDLYVWSTNSNAWQNVGTIQGPAGINGTNGTNGTSSYVYIRYSANSDGHDMTISPQNDTKYIGFAITESAIAPTVYTAYAWSKYSGEDGKNGTNGINNAMIHLYIRADSSDSFWIDGETLCSNNGSFINDTADVVEKNAVIVNDTLIAEAQGIPLPPIADTLYTFTTGTLSGNLQGWSQTVPEDDGTPCYITMAQAVSEKSTVTIPSSAWSTVAKFVEDGKDGVGTQTYYMPYAQAVTQGVGKPGDLLIDPEDDNKIYRMNDENEWVSVQDANIATLVRQLVDAKAQLEVLNNSINSKVEETYVTNQVNSLTEQFTSSLQQLSQSLTATFSGTVRSATGAIDEKYSTYIRASGDGVEIGRSDSRFRCRLNNERLAFVQVSGQTETEVAYFSNNKLYITNAQVTNELLIGTNENSLWKWKRTSTGLGLKYVS